MRGWGQAQQQHRMTPQHMESMRMAVTAVVEDMAPVQHVEPRVVHGVGIVSRGSDGFTSGSARAAGGEADLLPRRGEGPLADQDLAADVPEAAQDAHHHDQG